MIYGYVAKCKSSTRDTAERQSKELEIYAKDNSITFVGIIEEDWKHYIKTGKKLNFIKLKNSLASGDAIIMTDITKINYDYNFIMKEIRDLRSRGIRLILIGVPGMDDMKYIPDITIDKIELIVAVRLGILQKDSERRAKLTLKGHADARAEGVHIGRPLGNYEDFVKKYEILRCGFYGNITMTAFARMLNISRNCMYKYIHRYKTTLIEDDEKEAQYG